jgi:hypothetical protein
VVQARYKMLCNRWLILKFCERKDLDGRFSMFLRIRSFTTGFALQQCNNGQPAVGAPGGIGPNARSWDLNGSLLCPGLAQW